MKFVITVKNKQRKGQKLQLMFSFWFTAVLMFYSFPVVFSITYFCNGFFTNYDIPKQSPRGVL